MSMDDIDLYEHEYSQAQRRKYAIEIKDEIPASVTSEEIEEWINLKPSRIIDVNDGDKIDLGERNIFKASNM